MSLGVAIPLAIVALGFLIVVHEGGHYFVARWCGMRIERFSIGFGPGVIKRRSKKTGTTFQIAPVPFGGFVEIKGMNIAEDVDPDDKAAYPNKPAWQRFITIFAGPATNYVSAILIMFFVFTIHGQDVAHWFAVGRVIDDTYDAKGKLEPGDRILDVDGKPLFAEEGAGALSARVNAANGKPVTLRIQRGLEQLDVTVQPKQGDDKRWLLGIQPDVHTITVDVGLVDSVERAVRFPVDQTVLIGTNIYGIFAGKQKADPGGPTRMVEEFSHAFSAGVVYGVELLAMLSVWLGLFNLLPLPALDGGRLAFLTYELVTRRRANQKIEAMVHMAGIMVLGVVMILVTFRDIRHLF
ncbi:MAG TPA: M50 family metallopeptidase [Kofleriaceae bacterium]